MIALERDSTYKDLFNSLGFAVIVTTLFVSVGKTLTNYYFTIAIVVVVLVILPLIYHDYCRNRDVWFNAKQKMLQHSQRRKDFNKIRRKGVFIRLPVRDDEGKPRAHSDGFVDKVKTLYRHDVRSVTIVEDFVGCGDNDGNSYCPLA